MMSSGHKKLFQAYKNEKIASVAIAGPLSGTKICHNTRNRLAPSNMAASSKSLGIEMKNWRIKNVP